ncbi:MAG: hypothetical protein ACW99A_15175 [Candidatus Kariarchaeaceae archaeon]|jgi:hypothetical protein
MKIIPLLFLLIIHCGTICSQFPVEFTGDLTLLNPNGYENISQGKRFSITWSTTSKLNSFNIDLSTDGGKTWTNIVENLPGYQYRYDWEAGRVFSGNCKVKVSGTLKQGAIVYDESDNDFTIAWSNLFFDDFSYSNNSDPKLEQRGWEIINLNSSPPCRGSKYHKEMVSFEEDSILEDNKLLVLSTTVSNNVDSIKFSRIETNKHTVKIFKEGIYAARVMFDNNPAKFRDGNVETFYAINDKKCNDRKHSECDFEYLPYDVWDKTGNRSSSLHLASWEAHGCTGKDQDRSETDISLFTNEWELLRFEVFDGENVKYYKGSHLLDTHNISNQDHSVYPDSDMQIAFANWIWAKNSCDYQIGDSEDLRVSNFKVDFVFYLQKEANKNIHSDITSDTIESMVKQLREAGITYVNTVRGRSLVNFNESGEVDILMK